MDGSAEADERIGGATASLAVHPLLAELNGRVAGFGVATLSAPKQIAALALLIQAKQGLPIEAALQAAASAFRARLQFSAGGLKKAASEARAILQFGLRGEHFVAAGAGQTEDLLQMIEAAVRAVSLREVTQARAAALAGVRGGRPITARRFAYLAVQKLLEQARAGDAQARAELTAIQDLIQQENLAHLADCVPSSRA